MKNFLKLTLGYSLVFGVVALFTPALVAASDATQINLYGIDTSRIASTATGITSTEVAAVVLSFVIGSVLIANGKFLKRLLA